MQTTAELQTQFAIPDALAFSETASGLTLATISTPLAAATIYLQGAHLAGWTPAEERPMLFMSSRSDFAPGRPIRGGVPVIFPWFGPRTGSGSGPHTEPLAGGSISPAHGFARTLPWALESTSLLADGSVAIELLLLPNDTTRGFGYDDFLLRYRLTIGHSLRMELEVRNLSAEPLWMEEALHTYFSVSNIDSISVSGLEGAAYLDKVGTGKANSATDKADPAQRVIQPAEPIRFSGETDRLYLGTTSACVIDDPGWQRRILIEKTGSNSTVVWNPWIDKARALPDLGDDEWQQMVCVETVNAADDRVSIAPGTSHAMTATITVEARKS